MAMQFMFIFTTVTRSSIPGFSKSHTSRSTFSAYDLFQAKWIESPIGNSFVQKNKPVYNSKSAEPTGATRIMAAT